MIGMSVKIMTINENEGTTQMSKNTSSRSVFKLADHSVTALGAALPVLNSSSVTP